MTSFLRHEPLRRFGALIDHIYRGATDILAWEGIVREAAEWMEVPKGILLTPFNVPNNGGFVVPYGIDPGSLELWATRYLRHDVWASRLFVDDSFAEGEIVLGEHLIPRSELVQTIWYREFLARLDIVELLTSVIFDRRNTVALPVACSFFRGHKGRPFSDSDVQKYQLLIPHFSRALGVMLRLRDAEFKLAASASALDQLATGTVLIDEDGHVAFANKAAQRFLSEDDGLGLQALHNRSGMGRLHAGDPQVQRFLNQAIRNAIDPGILETSHFSRPLNMPRPSGRPPYCMQFSSLPNCNEFGNGSRAPRAIVFITDTSEPIRINRELLREIYKLTPAEVRATAALVKGGTLTEVASDLGIAVNTIKVQLKSIYVKTNVNDRARLVKLLVSLSQNS